jgi:hypothetical protein
MRYLLGLLLLFAFLGNALAHTTFGSVPQGGIPPCARSISALFFTLIALSNAGILRFAQNDTRWGYPLSPESSTST